MVTEIKDGIEDNTIEIEGSSEEEATQRACEALNTRLENLGYEVISDAKRGGLMGLMRGKKVRIKAWRKDARGQASLTPAGQLAKEALTLIIENICSDFQVDIMEQEDTITILIDAPDDGGLVIGKNGQTLDAMQYIVRRIVGKKFPDFEKQIIVNTESYRERKRDNLEMMAKRIAKQVRSSQREETLHPMNAFERRIVHVALENESGVVTRSQGEGIYRCIVVYPDAKKGEGSRRDSETATSENH
jgi:spoIIIJ-associated protein